MSLRNPNGFGCVVNLGKGRRRPYAPRVFVGYNENGSCAYKYLGYYERRKDAVTALAKYNANPYNLQAADKTFADVYALASVKAFRDASPQKQASYTAAFKHCSAIHNKKISQLRTFDLQNVLDACPSRSASSLNNIKIVMHTVFKFALQNDYITKDYSQFVEITNTTAKKQKNIFTDDEINLLWANADDFCCQVFLLLLYTGMRIEELLTTKLSDINFEEGYIKHGLKTESGKGRTIPIHHRIRPLVDSFAEGKPQDAYLVTHNDNKKILSASVRAKSKSLFAELRMKHNPHDARHTFASLAHRFGADALAIKKIMGHSANDLTKDVYTHIRLEELKEAIELIP